MNQLKIKLVSALIGASALASNVAFGQIVNIPGTQPSNITTVGGLFDIVKNVVGWIYILFFVIAVLFIIFAAFTYLTAGGDPSKTEQAKNQLIYAAVAIAVALLAVGFQQIISNFLVNPAPQA